MTKGAKSDATRARIADAARDLFAESGISSVSIRDIASAAGVTHALVHRYFGSKEDLVEHLLRRELTVIDSMRASSAPGDEVALLRRMLHYYLTDGRSTIRLFSQAELEGLRPERMLEGEFRPLSMLSQWIGEQQRGRRQTAGGADPALAASVVGAALFSFATMTPWLLTAVGLEAEDYDARLEEIVDLILGIALTAAGTEQARHPNLRQGL